MMLAADFALQSDPDRNPQFRRHWMPPDPVKRERRPGANGTALDTKQNIIIVTALLRHAQRLQRVAA
jgi:hypothetical protein